MASIAGFAHNNTHGVLLWLLCLDSIRKKENKCDFIVWSLLKLCLFLAELSQLKNISQGKQTSAM